MVSALAILRDCPGEKSLMRASIILSTHNPHPERFRRTLQAIADQSLPVDQWELLVIDNGSSPAVTSTTCAAYRLGNLRIVPEPLLGLSHARRRGMLEARGDFVVLVDDDNVLAPDYLIGVVGHFESQPRVGALGGRSLPEFETPPAAWLSEFFGLLALRDLGPKAIVGGIRPPGAISDTYPLYAPIGAGMALRRGAGRAWLERADPSALTDRRGQELTSGGDNDIVLHVLRAGWEVAYFPGLVLRHLIPASRLDPNYLARLNYGIQKSWMQVLSKHGVNDWPPIPSWTVPLRRAKAWFTHRAWSSPAARIRWQGACGHFEGRVARI